MSNLTKLSIANSSMILAVDDGIKVIWRHKDGSLKASGVYTFKGEMVASQSHHGDYEVPVNIADYTKEIL